MKMILTMCCLLAAFFTFGNDDLVIKNITIISPHLDSPQNNMNVHILDGRISKISNRELGGLSSKVLNGSGKYLTPGLMDSHIHVSSIPGMGFGAEFYAQKNKNIVDEFYRQQPRSLLYHGVTQILDPNPGINWHKFVSAKQRPDYFRCEVITSKRTFPYVEKKTKSSRKIYPYLIEESVPKNHPNSVETKIFEIAQAGASCIKVYFEDGYGLSSIWPVLKAETLARIKRASDSYKLPIIAHANAYNMQTLAVDAGVDVLAHGMWNWGSFRQKAELHLDIKKLLDKVIERKIGYMPTQRVIAGLGELMVLTQSELEKLNNITPDSLINWYKSEDAMWFKNEMRVGFSGLEDTVIARIFLENRIKKGAKVLNYLSDRKSPILLASDSPGSPSFANHPGLNTFMEMKEMVRAGLSLKEVLNSATINNAKQFKLQDKYGTVEENKIANLLVLERNPLTSIDAWNSIDSIILHGQVIERTSLRANTNQTEEFHSPSK